MPILSPDKRLLSTLGSQHKLANSEWFLCWQSEKFRDPHQKLAAINSRISQEQDKTQAKFLRAARLDFVQQCSKTTVLCNCGHPGTSHFEMGQCKFCKVRLTRTGTIFGCPCFKMNHIEAWPLAAARNRKWFEASKKRVII